MKLLLAIIVIALLCAACLPAPAEPVVPNSNPVIKDVTCPRDAMAIQDVVLNCIAVDPDGDSLTYKWAAEGGKIIGDGANVVYITPDTVGDYNLEIIVGDNKGGSDNRTFRMRILTNADGTTTPFIILNLSALSDEPFKASRTVKVGTKTKIICSVDNSFGENLTYNWSSGGGILKGDDIESGFCTEAFFIAPPNVKHYLVTIVASDKYDNKAEGQIDFDVFCCPRN